jgi:hypothetical protein
LCCGDGGSLADALALELAQRRQVVFYLLKGRQHTAAIIRHLLIVRRLGGSGLSPMQTTVENRE